MENNKEKTEKKETHSASHEHKHDDKHEHSDKAHEHVTHVRDKDQKHEHAKDAVHEKKTEVKEVKVTKPKVKKDVAVVWGPSVHMSKRHGMYICSFIKGKSIDNAMEDLEKVILIKKAVPFKGEIPHRKGKGMMSGRYPVAASKLFLTMLKNLKGNVLFNGMDLDKTRISSAYTNWASRPQRRGGQKGKRASVMIEAKELSK